MARLSSRRARKRARGGLIEALESRVLLSTTYYVSPTGNDSNNGTSSSTPWATLTKVDATAFAPGDQILFQTGGNWHGQLLPISSGTLSQPITFGEYGSTALAKPTFWGSDLIGTDAFTSYSGSVYTFLASALPGHEVDYVYANHAFLIPETSIGSVQSTADSFYIDGSGSGATVYLNTGGSNPQSSGIIYTATDRGDGATANAGIICSNGQSNLIFNDLVGEESAEFPLGSTGYVFRIMGSTNVQLNDCEAYNGGGHEFGVIDSTGFVGTDLYASGCMPGQAYGSISAFVSYSDAAQGPSSVNSTSQWIDCTVENFDPDGPSAQDQFSLLTHGSGMGTVLIENLDSLGCGIGVYADDNNQVTIEGGMLTGQTCDVYGNNIVVNGLTIAGDGKVDMWGNGDIAENCVDNGSTNTQAAIVARGANDLIRFNTLSTAANTWGIILEDGNGNTPASNTDIYGNLFTGLGNAIMVETGGTLTSNDNFYDNSGANGTPGFQEWSIGFYNLSLATWRTDTGNDMASLTGDPKFLDAADANFALGAGSPAIDQVPTAGITGIPTDFLGNARLVGSKYDMGAYEYQGIQPLALSTPATAVSANVGSTYDIDWTGGVSTDSVQVWVEGGPDNTWTELTTGVPDSQGAYAWNTTGVAHGWYYFQAWDIPASGTSYAVESPNYLHLVAPSVTQAPTVTLTNPVLAGEQDAQGSSYTINWTTTEQNTDTNPLFVQLWVHSGTTNVWSILPGANSISSGSSGSYVWSTTNVAPGWYAFTAHITDGDVWGLGGPAANSPGWVDVTVGTPTITYLTPTSGQTAAAGGSFNVQWSISGLSTSDISSSTVQVWAQYLSNGTSVWTEIAASVDAANGTYTWTVPSSPGAGTYYAFSVWMNYGADWWIQASPNWVRVT